MTFKQNLISKFWNFSMEIPYKSHLHDPALQDKRENFNDSISYQIVSRHNKKKMETYQCYQKLELCCHFQNEKLFFYKTFPIYSFIMKWRRNKNWKGININIVRKVVWCVLELDMVLKRIFLKLYFQNFSCFYSMALNFCLKIKFF